MQDQIKNAQNIKENMLLLVDREHPLLDMFSEDDDYKLTSAELRWT